MNKPTVAVRPARAEDIPRLVAMNHAAYPELVVGYLRDPRSCYYATLLEWVKPS